MRRPGAPSASALPLQVGYGQPFSPLSTQFLDQGFVAIQLKDHHLNFRLGPEPRPNMFTDVHLPPLRTQATCGLFGAWTNYSDLAP